MATTPMHRVVATRASAAEPWTWMLVWEGRAREGAYANVNHVDADAGAEGGFAGDGAAGPISRGFVIVVQVVLGRVGGGESEEGEEGGDAEGTWNFLSGPGGMCLKGWDKDLRIVPW